MRKNMLRLLFVVMLFAASLADAAIPPMPEIPTALPDAVRRPLIAKRGPLADKKLALIAEADSNKIKCANIVVGSEQHKSCLEMQKDFNARVETLRVEFEKLAGEIDAAVNKHAIKNLDPMVVDARNVPTGLPKFVEDNIPNTPAGNRIRRGFQAVMDHNWEVALVWFRDAHNHEPTDASIMRLIDLAEYTLYKGIVPRPPASNRTLTPEDKAQIEATMAALDHIGDTWMEDELVEALLDYCCRNGLREQPAGGQLQLPLDSDIEFLLDRNTVPAKPSVPTEKKQPHN